MLQEHAICPRPARADYSSTSQVLRSSSRVFARFDGDQCQVRFEWFFGGFAVSRISEYSSLPQMWLMRETNEQRSDGTNEMLGELKISSSVSRSSLQQQAELFQGIKAISQARRNISHYPIDVSRLSTVINFSLISLNFHVA